MITSTKDDEMAYKNAGNQGLGIRNSTDRKNKGMVVKAAKKGRMNVRKIPSCRWRKSTKSEGIGWGGTLGAILSKSMYVISCPGGFEGEKC